MPRNKTFDDVTQAIGDTPMIRLNKVIPAGGARCSPNASFFNRSIA